MMVVKQRLFDRDTTAIVYGHQAAAVQRMLDFDYACGRGVPSVAAIVNPTRSGWHLAHWGAKPVGLPMYRSLAEAASSNPAATVLINFASSRSAYGVTMEAVGLPQLRVIAIIAEGIPERRAREIAARAKEAGVAIIGPATVGGIAAGAFKIGNAGGTLENILEAKLNRPGHVAYVSRSGGLANELNNIIARQADGVYEGIAIGGDLYAGSTYLDHLLRFENDPHVALLVLLGEVGGDDEYAVVEALGDGRLTKPLVAWCIGTSAARFGAGVQFGHAGARADERRQTAEAKNDALRQAGAIVPDNFDGFGEAIGREFAVLVAEGKIVPAPEVKPRPLPMDYAVAVRDGVVRRMPGFVSGVSDDRGDELLYANMTIGEVVAGELGVGGVIGLLWFRRQLPGWASRFIELVLQITADHGPAVSGAHNTIVAARAGKDLISSVVSGMLTIGPRFGGAVEGAASAFGQAVADGSTPDQFVAAMRAKDEPIPGIGHLVKSITNPDSRVELLKDYARRHFADTRHLDFALAVEQLTTAKRDNLILNVDGCIGVLFLDLMSSTGAFEAREIQQVVDAGILNGLFVLGRTIGLIGHFIDQRRLQQSLYRHPWDDILYILPDKPRAEPGGS